MKTFDCFLQPLTEATERDLKNMGASPDQIDMLKKRQASRGKGFSTGDNRVKKTASSGPRKTLPPAKSSALATRPTSRGVRTSNEIEKRPSSALAKKPADKGAAIVRHRNELKKDAVQKMASGSAGTPKTSDKLNTKTRQQTQSSKAALQRKRQLELDRRRKQKEHDAKAGERYEKRKSGFGGGIKSALGGDVIGMRSKPGETKADREYRKAQTGKARADFAKKRTGQAVSAIKSAPGKALRTATNAARKSVSTGSSPASFGVDQKSELGPSSK